MQNLLVSRCYAHLHEQRTGVRRTLGDRRTTLTAGASQTLGRQTSRRRPHRPHRHPLRPKESAIPWEMLPKEMGCGSGSTCWRRMREWQEALVVWEELHRALLDRLGVADRIDWELLKAVLNGVIADAQVLEGPPGRLMGWVKP